jgi:integrase
MALTVKRVARLLRAGKPKCHHDKDGLYLKVSSAGRGSWVYRYEKKINGKRKERRMGLGSCGAFDLAEARKAARKALQDRENGNDPLQARQQRRAEQLSSITFADAAQTYFKDKQWKSAKVKRQSEASFEKYVLPKLGFMAVRSIDTPDILRVLEQEHESGATLWKAIPKTAFMIRGRIAAVLDWCAVRGFRERNNPAQWRSHLDQVLDSPKELQPVINHPALHYSEMPLFMAALRLREGVASRALEFCILTAVRTNEVLGARRSEINFEEKIWIVPASRMKTRREHKVPLSDRCVEILRELPHEDGNPFVFIGSQPGRGLAASNLAAVLRRMGRADITTHGMRSAFRTWAAECTAFPFDVLEYALAHSVGSKVSRSYVRTDQFAKRRKLMCDWAEFVSRPVPAVAPIRGALSA